MPVHRRRLPRPPGLLGLAVLRRHARRGGRRGRGLIERLPDEFDVLRDVDWYSEVVGSIPAHAIGEVALTRHADQIVVGSRGHGRARALLGSVSHELIHLATCPVTVIPERAVETEPVELDALTATA
jgi:nucleotide-binding universal stress UspA family protein